MGIVGTCLSFMFVYLLMCSDNATYIGATVNLERRLRQHNQEITGGAKCTGAKVKKGKTWKRVCYVSNFPDWSAALQFEWRWKHLSRKYSMSIFPLERRIRALMDLLALEKSTSKAIPFCEWETKPTIHVESVCSIYLTETHSSYDVQQIEPEKIEST